MTYTTEQIAAMITAWQTKLGGMEGMRLRIEFKRHAPAIVKQQQDRTDKLETALRDIALQCEFGTVATPDDFRALIQAKAVKALDGDAPDL